MTRAEADICLSEMDETQARVFNMFVGLGRDRSLVDLTSLCIQREISASISTLKRWSSQFEWFALAEFVGHEISSKLTDALLPAHVERAKKDLATISLLKERFHIRAQIDPTDETLPEAVRARAIDLSLADYLSLIKTERLILGDPTERKQVDETVTHKWAQEDIDRAAAALASSKYKLPPPEEDAAPVVTYDQVGEVADG